MRAAILTEYKKIQIGERPEPPIGRHDVLIEVRACGLCPTDYRLYAGISTWKKPPMVLGHEPSGIVVKVGEEVRNIVIGDTVAGDIVRRCGYCRECVAGRENLCRNRKILSEGALAKYIAANEIYINKFSRVTFDEATFSEPLACVINGQKNSRVAAGDRVAIIGAGQIGLMDMQISKLLGAETIMIDLRQERLDVATKLGSDHTINSQNEDAISKVKEITEGYGTDKVIIAVGNSKAVELGAQIIAKMGSLNLFGSISPPTETGLDLNLIHHGEISLVGSFDKTRSDLRLATKLIDEKKIDVKTLISHSYDLEESQKAFESLEAGTGTKVIVRPSGE